jgi:hypothetical protein
MKRPAFQFYPADWRKDAALQSCSLASQGLWTNLLCIAHECEPYGHLTINGKPMSAAQIARLVGLTAKECEKLLAELQDAGVSSVSDEGAIYSRRMVRDEDLRNRRADGGKAGSEHGIKGAAHGIKGGRPPSGRGVSEPPLEPPPSSSSSSSSSINPKHTHPLSATDGGRVCGLMRESGLSDGNPGHPDLLALIASGATDAEFIGAAHTAVKRGKGFAYAIGTLKRQRVDAAATAGKLHTGPLPVGPPDRKSVQLTTAALMTGTSRQTSEIIDVTPRFITAR